MVNKFAISGLVVSIVSLISIFLIFLNLGFLSFLINPGVIVFMALLAIVLGTKGLKDYYKNPSIKGKLESRTAIYIGILSLVIVASLTYVVSNFIG